jgi:hypothetical protein
MALDMLSIKVWLDGDQVEVTGVIPVEDAAIAITQSQEHSRNNNILLPFRLRL